MRNTGMARRLIQLLKVIRPPLPAGADYTVEEKAALYDQARRIFYDERGQLRSLDPELFGSEHRGPFRDIKSDSDARHTTDLGRRDKNG
jgi:hypothetical protein